MSEEIIGQLLEQISNLEAQVKSLEQEQVGIKAEIDSKPVQ
jgi:hypothetical protein